MKRREFLRLAATSSAFALSGPAGLAFARAGDDWNAAFRAALAEKPYLLGWLGTDEAVLRTPMLEIQGDWPEELEGTFYRNGPARHVVGGVRYRHWFDGDGMVQAFRMGGGHVSHLGRVVETEKYKAEIAAGRALRSTFGTAVPGAPRPPNPDYLNPANISVLSHAGRLFALWEGGSAHALDAGTLKTRGIQTWSPKTRGLPFGAHPRIDTDGTLWNIGYATGFDMLVIYRIGPDGVLKQAAPVKIERLPMIHDFVITERHLIVVLPPLEFERDGGDTFLDRQKWRAERPARVLIVDKADLSRRRLFEMPAHFTFHYGNAWEDKDGIIRLDHARYPDPTVMTSALRYVMRGDGRPALPARHRLVTIDPAKGRIDETSVMSRDPDVEFPRVDPRRMGRRYGWVTMLVRALDAGSRHPMLNTVARSNVETGRVEGFTYGPTVIPEEHVFVPRPGGGESDGWVMGTSLDFKAGVSRLSVFDAARLRDGPIAVASLPYALPLGFHGTYVPA